MVTEKGKITVQPVDNDLTESRTESLTETTDV